MKIDIKKIVLEEGILDGFKSKTGLGLAGIAGGVAGANIHKDFQNSGASSAGGYLGQKFGQAKDSFNSAKNDFNGSSGSSGSSKTEPLTGTHDSISQIGSEDHSLGMDTI